MSTKRSQPESQLTDKSEQKASQSQPKKCKFDGSDALPMLGPNQQKVFDRVKQRRSVLIHGSAGTGKTLVVNHIREWCIQQKLLCFTTAPTGAAAILVQGSTIHSWSGIYRDNDSLQLIRSRIRKNPNLRAHWDQTDVLIIDEISMMSQKFFDLLDTIAREQRDPFKPFGGLQVVAVGDFMQLPPVKGKFAFNSPAFTQLFTAQFELLKNYRQVDGPMQKLVHRLRMGEITRQDAALLQSRVRDLHHRDLLEVSRLYATNKNVKAENTLRLNMLKGPIHSFTARFVSKSLAFREAKKVERQLRTHCPCDEKLQLKVGARVMLTVNLSTAEHLINGSLGIVAGFDETSGFPMVKFKSQPDPLELEPYRWKYFNSTNIWKKRPDAYLEQIPLRLAFALTIHKTQGATLDAAVIDMASIFEYNQAYVALSRVKTLDGLWLLNFEESTIRTHPESVAFTRKLIAQSKPV